MSNSTTSDGHAREGRSLGRGQTLPLCHTTERVFGSLPFLLADAQPPPPELSHLTPPCSPWRMGA
jgi:hypothetical protein